MSRIKFPLHIDYGNVSNPRQQYISFIHAFCSFIGYHHMHAYMCRQPFSTAELHPTTMQLAQESQHMEHVSMKDWETTVHHSSSQQMKMLFCQFMQQRADPVLSLMDYLSKNLHDVMLKTVMTSDCVYSHHYRILHFI